MATKGARFCCAVNCSNNSRTSIDPRTGQKFRFHRFPTDNQRCERWVVNLQRADLNLGNVQSKHVCSAHFEEVAYNCESDIATSDLLPTAVPALVALSARTQSTQKPPDQRRCPGPVAPPPPPSQAVIPVGTTVTEASVDDLDATCTKTSHSNMKCKEGEGLDEQEKNFSLDQEDPEPPQIKEEQEELGISQEGEQLPPKQEIEGIIVWTGEERLRLLDTIWKPEIKLHRLDLQQQHISKEEDVLANQQVCNQEGISSLDHEEPEPPHIKEEQEDTYINQEGEQLVLKEETEIFVVTPTYEESDHSEPEPGSDQFPSHYYPDPESQDQPESNHVVFQSSKKSLNCEICGKTFQYKSKLARHVRAHTGEKPYFCVTCGKRFNQMIHLKKHIRIHTGEKPHSCSTCGNKFNDLSAFKAHMRIHTGEKPYSCSTCGKEFSQMIHVKIHMRVHTGEKPYSCSTCGKGFSNLMNLKTHIRIHTGEKPHSCSTCGKTFRQNSTLQTHLRIHTGVKPYSCITCGKRFSHVKNLTTHSRIHTGEKPYSCSTCGNKFSQLTHLKSHMKIHTPEILYTV